jgi:hypothetical protein
MPKKQLYFLVFIQLQHLLALRLPCDSFPSYFFPSFFPIFEPFFLAGFVCWLDLAIFRREESNFEDIL